MSVHIILLDKYEVRIGTDRPLKHIYASVFHTKGRYKSEPVAGFDAMSWYSPTMGGFDAAWNDLSEFCKKKGLTIEPPQELRDRILEELQRLYEERTNESTAFHNRHFFYEQGKSEKVKTSV
jgi:hypothetical protein